MTSLKQRTFKAIVWDLLGRFLTQGSSFVLTIILARLLAPEEFGVVAMAMAFITISNVFVDFGFSSALIQNQENTSLTYSSVFYFNVFAGLTITIIIFLLAPSIGDFYGNESIVNLVRWLSLVFLFNSFNRVQNAILSKELNFKSLSMRLLVASILGGIGGVILAYNNYGVYSLVFQTLSTAFFSTILLWSTSKWTPDLKFSFNEVQKLFGFSSYAFFERLINNIFMRLDVLLIGKIFTPLSVGFYTRASSLKDQVTKYSSTSITRVFYPVLSSLQSNDQEFQRIYFRLISVIIFMSFGLSGLLYILGEDIIVFLFGLKWMPSVLMFKLLVLTSCNQPLNSMMWNAIMSKGKSKENFYFSLCKKSVGIIPFVIAYHYGLLAFIISWVMMNYVITFMNIVAVNLFLKISLWKHIHKIFIAIIPLIISILLFNNLNITLFKYRILFAFAFSSIYLIYHWAVKSEGFIFILDNIKGLFKSLVKN